MHYVKHFNINGVDTKQAACIELHGKPNAATEGYVGVLAIDVDSPTHDVYKCVAVNGSLYTWELLSSGMSIISATTSGEGEASVQFSYENLKTPSTYLIKFGDLILDAKGYLYQVSEISSTYCTASYTGTHLMGGGSSGGGVELADYATKAYVDGKAEELAQTDKSLSDRILVLEQDDGTSEDVEERLSKLEKWMNDETYTTMTAKLSVSPTSVEYGDSVTGAKLTFSTTAEVGSIKLTLPNGTEVNVIGKTTYTDPNTYVITSKKTWKLTATRKDGNKETVLKDASVSFQYRVYWGVGTEASAFDSDFVRGLRTQNSTLTTSRNRSLSFNSISNQYVYYAIPTALGEPTFQIGEFPVTGGFEAGVAISVDTGFKDANGNPIKLDYKLYRSSNLLSNNELFKVYVT